MENFFFKSDRQVDANIYEDTYIATAKNLARSLTRLVLKWDYK